MDADRNPLGLATDLYEVTMAASYLALGMRERASFSLFVRRLPPHRAYLVACGLEEALRRLTLLRFDQEAVDYLGSTGQVRNDVLEQLAKLRFTGDVWAVPEGRIVFAGEPLLEVEGPIAEVQLAETMLLNALHLPTLVATKAARCVVAAPGKTLIDFSLRRTSGLDAGLAVARASYLAGFAATSNLQAGARYGIPVAGTLAHSFIQCFPTEIDAFRAFGETFPGPVTLLLDTYDTLAAGARAVEVARKLAERGGRLAAVRIDSGDLVTLSRALRAQFDGAGLPYVRIVASGSLDEYRLQELTQAGAPIDVYGVGTSLGVSSDAPSLDAVYKLVEYAGAGTLKLSPGKETLVGAKQVWREAGRGGAVLRDRISTRDESSPGGGWEPLLSPVMANGEILSSPGLAGLRAQHAREIASLPASLRGLDESSAFPVEVSRELKKRQRAAVAAVRRRAGL